MAAPQGPTSLNLSGIVDGTTIDAVDVSVPLTQAQTAIDEARKTVLAKETDTVKQFLNEVLAAGSGITLTENTSGGATTITIGSTGISTGTALPYFGKATAIPTGYLLANGQNVSMGAYEDLLDLFIDATDYYSTTVAATVGLGAGNAVTTDFPTDKILWTAHTLSNGDAVILTNSGGALPAPLAANTKYYVVNAATNDFQLSLTVGGTAIDLTDNGTGTHTIHWTYNIPDLRGRGFVGMDAMILGQSANRVTDASADVVGGTMGEETHTLTASELASHTHEAYGTTGGVPIYVNGYGYFWSSPLRDTYAAPYNQGGGGGDAAHNNMQPSMFGNWIIKY